MIKLHSHHFFAVADFSRLFNQIRVPFAQAKPPFCGWEVERATPTALPLAVFPLYGHFPLHYPNWYCANFGTMGEESLANFPQPPWT